MPRAFLFLIFITALINLIGVFIPETAFDALWYHLTIPKLYLAVGKIYHIPGGLLYYSELPRLIEILYIPLLKYLGDIGPHLLSWGSGIGAAIILYLLSRKFHLSRLSSLIACAVFYVTPLVSWQSGSAYVDLPRTFFEVLALYFVIDKKFLLAGLVTGLAFSTKTLALGSVLPLFLIILLTAKKARPCILYLVSCVFVAAPWFLSAYLNTGYPLYPIGVGILDPRHNLNLDIWNIPKMAKEFVDLWLFPEDPISPIYLIILPFLLLSLSKLLAFRPAAQRGSQVSLLTYCFITFIVWYVTPRTGGGRFILPYLPAWSVLVAAIIAVQKRELIKQGLVLLVIIISLINLAYRFFVLSKTIPYLSGRQTKIDYLCKNLDTQTAFVDCQNSFSNRKPPDLVYVLGYHNLYYINFPFVHETWYRGEKFDFVLKP